MYGLGRCGLSGAVAVSGERGDEANQSTQCERAQATAAARPCARRVRHMRNLRQASGQEPAHAAPAERGGRRDHPRVARRRSARMGQRQAHAPTLQPAQEQQERRVCASAARASATASNDVAAIACECMVTASTTVRSPGPWGGYPGRPRTGHLVCSADIFTGIR